MQTTLPEDFKNTPSGKNADSILRSCVHCGFCNATCPTYQLLGDELDGPRGRIYLIKHMLETQSASEHTRLHLDRCLTCRACETTCPSGVRYGELLDIGRQWLTLHKPRALLGRWRLSLLRRVLSSTTAFTLLLNLGRMLRPVLPRKLQRFIPAARHARAWPAARHPRRFLTLSGCVQNPIDPNIDTAAARVLDHFGISLVKTAGSTCCGALSHHLDAPQQAQALMRRNIDAWWPELEAGAQGIVLSASACAGMVKDYARLLSNDPAYAAKAQRVSRLSFDLSEVISQQSLSAKPLRTLRRQRVAWHAPCSLQHAQGLGGKVETLLKNAGYQLTPVTDAHLCCGSAGAYSLLQGSLSRRLLKDKISALEAGKPQLIASANIGCQLHLQREAQVPVKHWIELLEACL